MRRIGCQLGVDQSGRGAPGLSSGVERGVIIRLTATPAVGANRLCVRAVVSRLF
jgi:hypothetical protein